MAPDELRSERKQPTDKLAYRTWMWEVGRMRDGQIISTTLPPSIFNYCRTIPNNIEQYRMMPRRTWRFHGVKYIYTESSISFLDGFGQPGTGLANSDDMPRWRQQIAIVVPERFSVRQTYFIDGTPLFKMSCRFEPFSTVAAVNRKYFSATVLGVAALLSQ